MMIAAKCLNCGGHELTWTPHYKNNSGVGDGRLRVHDVACVFVLGCDQCSETLKVVSVDEIANAINKAIPAINVGGA